MKRFLSNVIEKMCWGLSGVLGASLILGFTACGLSFLVWSVKTLLHVLGVL